MKHFRKILERVDVAPLLTQIESHPELWNQHGARKGEAGSPHRAAPDIWVRYNPIDRLGADRRQFNDEHVPAWYPAWRALPALRPIIFRLMAEVEGEMLGGVLITKVPAYTAIDWHVDSGWHVDYFDKLYLSLKAPPGARFECDAGGVYESLVPRAGDVWLFDNRKPHAVVNDGPDDRVTLIVCIRTSRFGRQ